MSLRLEVQYAVTRTDFALPTRVQFKSWVKAALAGAAVTTSAELVIRLVAIAEITALNTDYRHKASPTNVLSFPFDSPIPLKIPLLGDILLCPAVIEQEALQQGKSLEAHWAHLVVHGVLHLLGYDHIQDEEQQQMEQLEIAILAQLGFANPYHEVS